jgi:hypothetical protein
LLVGQPAVRTRLGGVPDRLDIAIVGELVEMGVGHAELFALIHVGRAAVQVQDRGEHRGGLAA